MLASYGYQDASGEFFITIDTDRCDGCGKCVDTCPGSCFEVLQEDPNDPLREEPVVAVVDEKRKMLKYACTACKSNAQPMLLPCIQSCPQGSITHSW